MAKAQGLSINTIIIAALGLAVLVVLFAVFTGRIGIFGKNVDDTGNQLKTCAAQCQVQGYVSGLSQPGTTCQGESLRIFGSFTDVPDGNSCCCSR